MEELLFGMTPAEWWVWNYLIYLAHKQGSNAVILPGPGEDVRVEAIYSRKHLKRILKALKSKFQLTNLVIPRSKSKQIEVFLPASKIGDTHVPNTKKGCMDVPNNEGRGAPMSPIRALRTPMSSIKEVIQATSAHEALPQAKLKEKLIELIKLKQGDLKGEIKALRPSEVYQLRAVLGQVCKWEPKSKSLSEAIKVYAVIRLLQEGETIQRPQAWVDTVAREAGKSWNEIKQSKKLLAIEDAFRTGNIETAREVLK